MSVSINNIFNYSRPLPEPFDTITNKKVKVSSKYGDVSMASTLCATVIKAVHAVCRCMNGSGEGAVGVIDHRTVAEYKSSIHCRFDNGRYLGVIPGVDVFRKMTEDL